MEEEIIITGNVNGATDALNKVQSGLAKTAVAANKLDSALDKTRQSTNAATRTMVDLGRVVQDAPYGFIGIANNLNPLIEGFDRLKATTGSTGSALKALGSSLIGAGGLGFAVSAISTLLVVFGDKLFGAKKQTDLVRIAANEYEAAMQKSYEAAAKQVSQVSQIIAALEGQNATLAQRKKLLEELNGINGTYFNGLKIEEGQINGLAEAYRLYADNIFKVAKAKAAQDQIQKLSTELVKLTDQINTTTNALSGSGRELTFADAARGIDAIKKDYLELNKIINSDVIQLKDFALVARLTGKSEQEINELLSKRRGLRTEELKTLARIADLSKYVATNDLGSIIGFVKPEKVQEAGISLIDQLKKGLKLLKPETLEIPIAFTPVITLDFTKERIERAIAEGGILQLSDRFKFEIPINFKSANTAELEKIFKDMQRRVEKLQGNLSDTLIDMQTQLFEGLVEGVGKAFAGGDLGDIFGDLFGIIGSGLKQLGKTLIEFSGLLKAIKVAFNSLNPILAAGAGIALVALGSFIESRAPRLATGGIVPDGFPNDSFPAFLKSNEAVIPLDRINDYLKAPAGTGNVRVTGKLRGKTLYLLNQNTVRSNSRTE